MTKEPSTDRLKAEFSERRSISLAEDRNKSRERRFLLGNINHTSPSLVKENTAGAGTGSARVKLLSYTAEPARRPIPGCEEHHRLGAIVPNT